MPVKFAKHLKIDSLAMPGVSFTLKKMTEARRAEFFVTTAVAHEKLHALASDPESQELEAVKVRALELNPAWVRWGLKSIDGLELDNEDGTVTPLTTADQLIADGPQELFAEICAAIQKVANLTDADLKNFVLPSISGAQTDGSVPITSAETASSADGSDSATAASTSQQP